jgi:acylphosphatase
MAAERTAHFLVEGLVQGVGFRAWLERQAAVLSLTGWVRNRRTGAVETVVSGQASSVETMIAACRIGPSHARIDALYIIGDVRDASLGSFACFEVRPTG